jgi:hypothetical protein
MGHVSARARRCIDLVSVRPRAFLLPVTKQPHQPVGHLLGGLAPGFIRPDERNRTPPRAGRSLRAHNHANHNRFKNATNAHNSVGEFCAPVIQRGSTSPCPEISKAPKKRWGIFGHLRHSDFQNLVAQFWQPDLPNPKSAIRNPQITPPASRSPAPARSAARRRGFVPNARKSAVVR